MSGSDNYDDQAFRYAEACTVKADVPFETLARHAVELRSKANLRLPDELQTLVDQEVDLIHRPIELPSGRFSYKVVKGLILITTPDGLDWVLSTNNARMFDQLSVPHDVQPVFHGDEGLWLPLPELVEAGHFPRMQEIRDRLRVGVRHGDLRLFVSHRWKSLSQPDPHGEQARTVAWRLVGALCQAVRVAWRRGLHMPRRRAGGFNIGPAGSTLAESIIVNVLRAVLGEEDLREAVAEATRLNRHVDDLGATQARSDTRLAELRSVLTTVPLLRNLIGHIHLWYDWSCMPQNPRTDEEDAFFLAEMNRLNRRQLSSRTLVLLDDVHDYLGRAWCHLEVSFAAQLTEMDVIWFDETPQPDRDSERPDLVRLVHHRRLVAWRALLDTELLQKQTPLDCLRRLGLAAAEQRDLSFIYGQLLSIGAPSAIEFSPASLVTGVAPLPAVEDGRSVLALVTEADLQPEARTIGTINLADCLRITGSAVGVPAFQLLKPSTLPAPCHVAVFASCEAEAVLISTGLRDRLPELERRLAVNVVSMSWLSVDVVPVGHRVDGSLRTVPVTADLWVLVGTVPSKMLAMYTQLLSDANTLAVTIDLTRRTNNISQLPTGLEWRSHQVATDTPPAPHDQGILLHHFYSHLLQPGAPIHGR